MTTQPRPITLFVLSVDTEEEWDWQGPFPQQDCHTENLKALPAFQDMSQQLGIRPTYFVDYAVANDPFIQSSLRRWHQQNKAEVAAHLHPWCTPPYYGYTGDQESHVVNLPLSQVQEKLAQLTAKIEDVVGERPKAFRTGRWGINGDILKLLHSMGYEVDSSVYPYYHNDYFDCNGAEPQPYWPSLEDTNRPGEQRDIFEVPISAGFNRSNYGFCSALHRNLSKAPARYFKLIGALWRSNLLKKIYLSPELASERDMKQLVDTILALKLPVIHMFFHSSSLLPGRNTFVKTPAERDAFLQKIESVFRYCQLRSDLDCCTVSEVQARLPESSGSNQ